MGMVREGLVLVGLISCVAAGHSMVRVPGTFPVEALSSAILVLHHAWNSPRRSALYSSANFIWLCGVPLPEGLS